MKRIKLEQFHTILRGERWVLRCLFGDDVLVRHGGGGKSGPSGGGGNITLKISLSKYHCQNITLTLKSYSRSLVFLFAVTTAIPICHYYSTAA